MITPTRVSYAVLAVTIILAKLLHLGAPLLVVLFSYFALRQFYFFTRRKWLSLALFIVVVAGIVTLGVYFTRAAILAILKVSGRSSLARWGRKHIICATSQTSPKRRPRIWLSASLESSRLRACFSKQGSTRTAART